MKELNTIQVRLNAPKSQFNKFGGYAYRSCEDILEAVKPLLKETGCTLNVTDEIVLIGNRFYVKATATIKNEKGESESATAYAREPEVKKGQDESQITGSASSYARKYSLNGLLCIDDNKDADATNTHDKEPNKQTQSTKPTTTPTDPYKALKSAKSGEELNAIWAEHPELQNDAKFVTEINKRAAELNK